jgi:hypothetical protein
MISLLTEVRGWSASDFCLDDTTNTNSVQIQKQEWGGANHLLTIPLKYSHKETTLLKADCSKRS